jgi:hypothetical protein
MRKVLKLVANAKILFVAHRQRFQASAASALSEKQDENPFASTTGLRAGVIFQIT